MTPKEGMAVPEGFRPTWPDRSHRSLAEVWALSAAEIVVEQKQYVEPLRRDWRRA